MTKTTPMRDLIPFEPVKVVRRSATSIEQIRADVAARFVNRRFDLAPDAERVRKRMHTSLQFGGMQIDHFEMVGGQTSGIKAPSFELMFTTKGAVRVTGQGRESLALPDGNIVGVGGDGSRLVVKASPGAKAFMLSLSPDSLQTAGTALLGEEFRLDPKRIIDTGSGAGQALSRNVRSIYLEVLELEKDGLGSLVTPTYKELLGNLWIAAAYPEHWAGREAEQAPSKLVGAAEEIIRTRAMEPLTVREIAAEVGVTVRALQLGFRKHVGCSPLQYLLSRRLFLARERLLDPAFSGNVQFAAMSCGFMNMSKFSSRYRATFGELPSETMIRGRRVW